MIYLVVLIDVQLSGKREVGWRLDLTLLLLLSNSVQNAMTGPHTSLIGGVAASYALGSELWAEPIGSREYVNTDEPERALREHGITNVKDIALAVLESMPRSVV